MLPEQYSLEMMTVRELFASRPKHSALRCANAFGGTTPGMQLKRFRKNHRRIRNIDNRASIFDLLKTE